MKPAIRCPQITGAFLVFPRNETVGISVERSRVELPTSSAAQQRHLLPTRTIVFLAIAAAAPLAS
jgi:hypothetical protein